MQSICHCQLLPTLHIASHFSRSFVLLARAICFAELGVGCGWVRPTGGNRGEGTGGGRGRPRGSGQRGASQDPSRRWGVYVNDSTCTQYHACLLAHTLIVAPNVSVVVTPYCQSCCDQFLALGSLGACILASPGVCLTTCPIAHPLRCSPRDLQSRQICL